MHHQQIKIFLEKILNGVATPEERDAVERWFISQCSDDMLWEMDQAFEEHLLEQAMYKKVKAHIRASQFEYRRYNSRRILSAAAMLILFIAATWFMFSKYKDVLSPQLSGSYVLQSGSLENRFILLPDSSKVLLHPGSRISYTYTSRQRRITLVGEAYFDVKHITGQPFLIKTGKVLTTVLGTAFNVRARQGGQVAVTVSRGKVSVSNANHRILAVLTPNQTAEINEQAKLVNKKTTRQPEELQWIKTDMQFENLQLAALTQKLERRYGVKISIDNAALNACPVTGRFIGTESMKEVLRILSQTLSLTIVNNGETIHLNGTGCQTYTNPN